jgi:hypothetical protein
MKAAEQGCSPPAPHGKMKRMSKTDFVIGLGHLLRRHGELHAPDGTHFTLKHLGNSYKLTIAHPDGKTTEVYIPIPRGVAGRR